MISSRKVALARLIGAIVALATAAASQASSQPTGPDSYAARGKRAFSVADSLTYTQTGLAKPDTVLQCFHEAESLLVRALELAPDDPELHYVLGCCYQRLTQARFGDDYLRATSLESAVRVSDEMQKAVARDKHYRGKIIILGPYEKIASEWGSLAQTYALRGEVDSARWALKEGRRRGGFSDVVLEYARNLLTSCPPEAILFVNGDMDTFPLWYVQFVEDYRRDVTLANLSLCNTSWYVKHLKHGYAFGTANLPLTYSDRELDSLRPVLGEGTTAMRFPLSERGIARLGITDRQLLRVGTATMTIQPQDVDGVHVLYVQDRILLDVMKANAWERPVCISTSVEPGAWIGLAPYTRQKGMAAEVMPAEGRREASYAGAAIDDDAMQTLLIEGAPFPARLGAPEARLRFAAIVDTASGCGNREGIALSYRYLYLQLADHALNALHDRKAAATALAEMERVMPRRLLPLGVMLNTQLSDMYMASGDTAAAVTYAREAVASIDAADPDSLRRAVPGFDPRLVRADMLLNLGRYDDAIGAYRMLLADAPNDWSLHLRADDAAVRRLLAAHDSAGAMETLRGRIEDAKRSGGAGAAPYIAELRRRLSDLSAGGAARGGTSSRSSAPAPKR